MKLIEKLDVNRKVELRFSKLDNELSFVIGIDFEPKYLLKSLSLSLKSVTSLLPTFSIVVVATPHSGVSLGTPVLCKSSICLYIQTIPGFELSFQK